MFFLILCREKQALFIFRSLTGKQKIIKPLRSLRLCGEFKNLAENPATYLPAQVEIF